MLWRAFEKAPSFALYLQLREVVGDQARDHATDILRTKVTKQPSTEWSHSADLLVQILMHEKAFDTAWSTVDEYGASMAVQLALAKASEAACLPQAIAAYALQVDHLVNRGGDPSYAEAVKLLKHLATMRTPDAQANHIAALKTCFVRKRNFMKLLD